MSTNAAYAPAHLVTARTAPLTTANMSAVDIDTVIVYGDSDTIRTGERHLVIDIRGGWLTVARQEWRNGEWSTLVEHKRRRRDLVGQGGRTVTDHGAWLRPDWTPNVPYTASLPGSLVVVVIESADASADDNRAGFAFRESAERAGIVVEWQGSGACDGRVHAFAAPAHLVDTLREIVGWFVERGAHVEYVGGACSGPESHSRRPDECRKCGQPVGKHNRAPRQSGPSVLDRADQPVNPGDLVKRVVIVPAGTGTQEIGEHGTVIYASDPAGRGVLVEWERTTRSTGDGGPAWVSHVVNSYAGHVTVVDQVPDVKPTPAAPVGWDRIEPGTDQDAPAAPVASDDQDADACPVTTADQPGPGFWNCCAARPGAVIVMDSGRDGAERDAFRVACASDAATYARLNGDDRVLPLPAGYVTPAECPAAQVMLTDDRRTADAERAAGTYVWGDRPLPVAALVHTPDVGDDAESAYAYTQCSDDMRDGDLIHVPALSLVAVLVKAWPCAVTVANGEGDFHRYVTGGSPENDARYADRFATARAFATAHGYPLHSDGGNGGGEGGDDQPTGPAPDAPAAPASDDQDAPAAPAATADVDVWETLAASVWSGAVVKVGKGRERRSASFDVLTLPAGRLDRPVYLAVAAVVESLGGRWSKAARGFAFLPSETVWDASAPGMGRRTESGAQRLDAWLLAHGGADATARVAEDAAADQDDTPAADGAPASDDQDAPAGEVWRGVPIDAHTTCAGCGQSTIYGGDRATNGTVTLCGRCNSNRLDGIWDAMPGGVYGLSVNGGAPIAYVSHTPREPHVYADEPGRPHGAERCSECQRHESSPIHTPRGGGDQPGDGPAPVAGDDQDTPTGDITGDTTPNGGTVAPVTSTTESEAPAMSTTPTATIDRETLAAVLSYLAAGAPTRANIEHITGAVLSIDADGAVSAYTTDYDQWRIARASAADGAPVTPGRVWLPVHNVSAMVSKWRGMGDQVTITTSTDRTTVTLTCGRGRMTVKTLNTADMPTLPDMPPAAGASDARTFADVTARVAGTAGTDATLPVLTHVRMATDGPAFRFAATDRYRFGFGVAPRTAGADVAPVLVPAAPLASLAKWIKSVLGASGTDTVTVHAAGATDKTVGWSAFTFGAYTMIVRLGEGDFPNMDALLPDTYTAAADVPDVSDLVATIGRVTTGAAKDAPVLLTLDADSIAVECGSDDTRNTETVPGTTWDGDDGAATLVNAAFLVAALKACADGARLMFTTSRKPFVVAPSAGVNVGTLVVPIRREGHTDAPMGANTIHNPLKGDPTMSTPAARKSSKTTRASKSTPAPAAAVPASIRAIAATVLKTADPAAVAAVAAAVEREGAEPAPAAPVKVPAAERAAARAFKAYAARNYPAARAAVAEIIAAGGESYLVAGKRPVSAILAAITDAENLATPAPAAQSDDTAPAAPAVVDTPAAPAPVASDDQDAPADTAAADAEALDTAADAATVAVLDNTADTAPAADGARVATDATGGAASIAWTLAKWTDGTPGYKARRAAVRKALMAAGYRVHADGGESGRECVITMDGGIPADAVRVIIATVEPMLRTLATTGA